jgi:hypothetical protein
VRKLVRHHVFDPWVRPSQFKIKRGSEYLDFIIVKVRGAVRVIVVILDDKADFLVRLMLIQRGNRLVNSLGDTRNLPCCPLGSIVKMDKEMLGFHRSPLQLGMREVILADGK